MPVFDLYSKRKRLLEKEGQADPLSYDDIPKYVRTQIAYVLEDAVGRYSRVHNDSLGSNNAAWEAIESIYMRERGVRAFGIGHSPQERVLSFLENVSNVDSFLDVLEIALVYVDKVVRQIDENLERYGIRQEPDDAIEEINIRFREASIGYQYVDRNIIRIDSQYTHSEIVVPALALLSGEGFSGAHDEFLSAHAHYRASEYKDCVVDALNSYESVLKTICDQCGWEYDKGASATHLLKACRKNGLFPTYLDRSFEHLLATLQSGLPDVRNEGGGHGQGQQKKSTPAYVAAYALHMCAAQILMLMEAYDEKRRGAG